MDLDKLHESIKLRPHDFKGPRYYDYPDGEDLLGKLSYTTKIAAGVSTIIGVLNTRVHPIPRTLSGKMMRLFSAIVPSVGIAATFTCVTYYATVLRKKDDELNYVLGGLAAGALVGPVVGGLTGSAWAAFYFAFIGYAKKAAQLKGETIIPQKIVQKQFSTYHKRKFDTSLMAEKKGNWTREPAQ